MSVRFLLFALLLLFDLICRTVAICFGDIFCVLFFYIIKGRVCNFYKDLMAWDGIFEKYICMFLVKMKSLK